MSTTHRTGAGGDAASTKVVITTTPQHLQTLRDATLRELHQLLDTAAEEVDQLTVCGGELDSTLAYDVRSHMSWIVEAIETLDDLGWARDAGWKGYVR